jgi:hypothetical protein
MTANLMTKDHASRMPAVLAAHEIPSIHNREQEQLNIILKTLNAKD